MTPAKVQASYNTADESLANSGGALRIKWTFLISLSAAFVAMGSLASAQTKPNRGESALAGIRLFDSGMRLLQVYGNPDEILPVGASSASGGRGPAGGGKAGGAAAGGGGGPSSNPRGGVPVDYQTPFEFGNELFRLQAPDFMKPEASFDLRQGKTGGASAGAGDGGGRAGGQAGGGGGGGGQGAARSAPGSGQFLRWIYKRNGCLYGFIIDGQNRVVQIEAVGLTNKKIQTKRGIGFGDSFKEVMSRYQVPEGYQINGDTIVMRYLVRDKVAFRLNRLGMNKPHVVTAIVVAAGKT